VTRLPRGLFARHGRSLLRLSGVPLRLVSTLDPSAPPALDLSGLRLTTLGLDCTVRKADRRRDIWLAPGFLPQSLVELELRGVGTVGQALLFDMGWAAHPALRPEARPPALQRVSVSGRSRMQLDGLALLQGLATAPALSVESGRSHLAVHARVLERVRSLHLRGAPVCLDCSARRGQAERLARSVCPPGLQSVTLEAVAKKSVLIWFEINPYALSLGYTDAADALPHSFRAVLRTLLERRAGRFAFEVGVLPGDRSALQRLAWRAWPPRGSPAWTTAAEAHARAAAWADEPDPD
jgi:hypothetical protein